MRFSRDLKPWHGPCSIYLESFIPSLTENRHEIRDPDAEQPFRRLCAGLRHDAWRHDLRRIVMKFETLMLNSLFTACVLICVMTLGAML